MSTTATTRRIHVMAAVIQDALGNILIAKRPDTAHQGGLWEFPGGKLEEGEQRLAGLTRELQEELGIQVTEARPLLDIRHDYSDKSVRLDVWLVSQFTGEAHGAEGQPVRWVKPSDLDNYAFPAANAPIVQAAQLPTCYLITPDMDDQQALLDGLERAIQSGIRLIQLRQTALDTERYKDLIDQVLERFGNQAQWMVKGEQAPRWPGVGWHLTARQLQDRAQKIDDQDSAEGFDGLLAASCHNVEELAMAERIGVSFVTLSPVLATASHPQATPLGWNHAQELISYINLPVYALGGVDATSLPQAFTVGAQGIAGIRGLWPA